jgi:hypothetical protein
MVILSGPRKAEKIAITKKIKAIFNHLFVYNKVRIINKKTCQVFRKMFLLLAKSE